MEHLKGILMTVVVTTVIFAALNRTTFGQTILNMDASTPATPPAGS